MICDKPLQTVTKTRQKFYETSSKLFGELLQRKLVIPMSQRAFEWEETHVLEYLDDIWSTFLNGKCDFSGGTTITYKECDTHEIYDGQQRIISTLLILSALYGFCSEKLKKKFAKIHTILYKQGCDEPTKEQKRSFSSIKKQFDNTYGIDEDEDGFDEDMLPNISCINPSDAFALTSVINHKVKPHNELYAKETSNDDQDKVTFRCKCKCNVKNSGEEEQCTYSTSRRADMMKHISNSHKIDIPRDSQIYEAYSVVCYFFEEKRNEIINRYGEKCWITALRDIINFILNSSWFDVKVCSDYDFACQEFDRANNRGTPLFAFDIILNKIMQSDGVEYDQRLIVHEQWGQKIKRQLYGKNGTSVLEKKYGQKLFDIAIQLHNKKCIATSRSNEPEGCDRISMFVNGLLKGSNILGNINNFFSIYEKVNDFMNEIMNHNFIKIINYSGKKGSLDWAFIHFILQISYIKDKVDNNLLDLVSGWYIRRRVVDMKFIPFNNYGYGNVMEKIVAHLYKNPEYDYKKDIMKLLYKNITTNKGDFITKFNQTFHKLSSKDKTNVLKYLELKISRCNDTEPCKYTLEHIYSQNKAKTDCISENIVNSVGNCTLFEGENSYNGEEGNFSLKDKSFAEKRAAYSTSQSVITQKLDDDKWNGFDDDNITFIDKRNKILIKMIEKQSRFWIDINKKHNKNEKILGWLNSDKYLYEA
uniref:DUF262 domain-containing protein n=1 Tax=viral metagenome TaxID=1070528 RepID=A0A6C0L2T2_9ZZZZ|tara:strand:+ start:193 stop:2298 length:2106 start_codon:yes stop_codon:yes gene_type:complete